MQNTILENLERLKSAFKFHHDELPDHFISGHHRIANMTIAQVVSLIESEENIDEELLEEELFKANTNFKSLLGAHMMIAQVTDFMTQLKDILSIQIKEVLVEIKVVKSHLLSALRDDVQEVLLQFNSSHEVNKLIQYAEKELFQSNESLSISIDELNAIFQQLIDYMDELGISDTEDREAVSDIYDEMEEQYFMNTP